jgi:hypothetical protein
MALSDFIGQLPNMSAGIDASLARNAQLGQQQQQMRPQGFGGGVGGGGLRDFLGHLGDALLVANGHQPMYAARAAERKRSAALQQFLGGVDPELGAMIGAGMDPSDAVSIYKMKHPGEGNKPSFVQEYEYRERLDPEHRKAYDAYAEQRKFNPYAPPITMGQNDTLEMPGQKPAQSEVTATDKDGNKVRYNHETGAWEPVGGPTASAPSAPFP